MFRSVVTVIALFVAIAAVFACNDPLRRQAYFGAALDSPEGDKGAEVLRVREGSPAEQMGLQRGDRVLKMNGHKLVDALAMEKVRSALRAGDTLQLEVRRGSEVFERQMTLPELPRESIHGLDIYYDSAPTTRGFRVRTIVTRPAHAQGPLPGIFLAPWLSCDSVEMPFGPGNDGMLGLLHALASQSGFVTMRVERPGLGDSQGPPCSEVDFLTELDSFKAAFQVFRASKFVDPNRIFVLGLSNGGGYAPLVAPPGEVAGFVSIGGWAKTWFEHMLEHERRRLELQGLGPGEVTQRMAGYAEFYTDYLIRKLTPGEVLRRKPYLAKLWYDMPKHQYGRPASFFHQLQELNVLAAWQGVTAPVLAIWGEHDWIMSRDDHELIAKLANQRKPGSGRFVVLPRTTHNIVLNEGDAPTSENFRTGTLNPSAVRIVLDWLREVAGTDTPNPSNQMEDQSKLFDQFLGDWEFDLVQVGPDGSRRTGKGEWHFASILEGRAIQDVWIARFPGAKPGDLPEGHGTTLRVFDPQINAWRIAWMSAARRNFQLFTARRIGPEIVLELVTGNGSPEQGKWIFSEITNNSFRWRAVESEDGGRTWRLLQEMHVRRVTP